jgi:hypothetical protein
MAKSLNKSANRGYTKVQFEFIPNQGVSGLEKV